MSGRKVRRFVKLFQERFAPLVESGKKRQTIRPVPKGRRPEAGDVVSLRCWTGKPYRSKQRVLGEGVVVRVCLVRITDDGPVFDGVQLWGEESGAFARDDGFGGWVEMREWFEEQHGLPFEGILIVWEL